MVNKDRKRGRKHARARVALGMKGMAVRPSLSGAREKKKGNTQTVCSYDENGLMTYFPNLSECLNQFLPTSLPVSKVRK